MKFVIYIINFFIDKIDVYDEKLKLLRVIVDIKIGMRYFFIFR